MDDYEVDFKGLIIGWEDSDGTGNGGYVQGERPHAAIREFVEQALQASES